MIEADSFEKNISLNLGTNSNFNTKILHVPTNNYRTDSSVASERVARIVFFCFPSKRTRFAWSLIWWVTICSFTKYPWEILVLGWLRISHIRCSKFPRMANHLYSINCLFVSKIRKVVSFGQITLYIVRI